MGTITFEVSDKEERRIRRLVEKYYGNTKEDFDKAVEEAIKIWIEEKKKQKKDSLNS